MKVAALIPAYQAAATVGQVVRETAEVLSPVFVVDDGSTDGTGEAAREAGAEVVVHAHNRGKGAALQTGFDELVARGFDGVVTLDADGQHLPGEIPKLLAAASENGADVVLGVRDKQFDKMGLVRRVSNIVSSGLISMVARQSISDIQTGFRYYSRRLMESVEMHESGFAAESSVLVRAGRRGFVIATTPVELEVVDGRGTSHFRSVQDSWRIAQAVVRARFDTGKR